MIKKLAICYDFDRTLTPTEMQAQGLIQSFGMSPEEFWKLSGEFSKAHNVEENLSYMYCLKVLAESQGRPLTYNTLKAAGKGIAFFPGVESWFRRVNAFGASLGVEVKHYIISSGLKEIVEGTTIAEEFDKLYASSYFYGEDGFAKWCSLLVNYTNKTQFLFRISKGIFCELDKGVNDKLPTDAYCVPFTNFVYIGDSDTDIPCMALINKYFGTTIGVYSPADGAKALEKAAKLLADGRVKHATSADYSEGGDLEKIIKDLIYKIANNQ